jgi:hypothetical protein
MSDTVWIILLSVGLGYVLAQIESCWRELRALSNGQ